jgi:hypothetical protein
MNDAVTKNNQPVGSEAINGGRTVGETDRQEVK